MPRCTRKPAVCVRDGATYEGPLIGDRRRPPRMIDRELSQKTVDGASLSKAEWCRSLQSSGLEQFLSDPSEMATLYVETPCPAKRSTGTPALEPWSELAFNPF
jgi:hypothetical protein